MKKSDDITQDHWLYKVIAKGFSSREKIAHRVICCLNNNNNDINKTADSLIRSKTRNTTTIGACTGALSVIPVMGTIAAVATTLTGEFVYVSYKEIELCMEIASNYGFDLDDQMRIFECLAIVGRKKEIKSVKDAKIVARSKAFKAVIRKYVRIGILKALSRAAKLIEIRTGLRVLTKGVPVIGAAAGGAINYVITRNTGLIAQEFYRNGGLVEEEAEKVEQDAVNSEQLRRKKEAVKEMNGKGC
jgi:hypothetical protein